MMNERYAHFIARFERHPMRKEIENALAVGERYAENVRLIKADKNLSDEGRANRFREQTRLALRDVREASAPIDEMKKQLATIKAQIKPAAFDKSDLAAAILRSDLRKVLAAMSIAEKASILLGEKADPACVDAILEGPALLSGVDASMHKQVKEQRLKTLFTQESFQAEALSDRITEAEAAMQIARDDIGRVAALPAHEIAKIAEAVASRKNAPWIRRVRDAEGNERVIVIPVRGGPSRPATPAEVREGKEYTSYEAYLADRAA